MRKHTSCAASVMKISYLKLNSMFVINFEATIGDTRFRRLHSVEIEHSIKKIGKRARLKLPTTARLERQGELISEVEVAKQFRTGDAVTIRCGYDGDLRTEFVGYVRRIKPTVPLEIECEDAGYLLRRKNLQAAFRGVTLAQLLETILLGTGISIVNTVPEINFRTFAFRNVNAAQALEKLRKQYGLTMYFTGPESMIVGLASETDGTKVKYTIGRNVIEHNLEWESEEDVQLKIKAVAVSQDNTFTEERVGDPDGDLRTIYLYNLSPGANLRERAEQELVKYKYSGYRGSLTGFLRPSCEVGNTVQLKDELFENRDGDYLVEATKLTLNDRGGRRKVTLGLKLD